MTVTQLGWRDSINAIRGARNCANPNFGFQKQLQDYENEGLEKVRTRLVFIYEAHLFMTQRKNNFENIMGKCLPRLFSLRHNPDF